MKRFLLASLLLPTFVLAYVSPGQPTGLVNDFANLLRPDTVASLESTLRNLRDQTGSEISVVTIESLGGDTIENFAVKLFEEWGIGRAREDDGLLLLVSKNDRQMRIEVGYGLEGVITDIESSRIISDLLIPNFKENNYDAGVSLAVERIIKDIQNGAPLEMTPIQKGQDFFNNFSEYIYPIVFLFIFFSSVLGRSKSWWLGGVIGAVLGIFVGIFAGFIFNGLFAIFGLTLLGLVFDFFVSRVHDKHKGSGTRPPWWLGGGGSSGGISGGFGGFGGGMSGGGGSSGRW